MAKDAVKIHTQTPIQENKKTYSQNTENEQNIKKSPKKTQKRNWNQNTYQINVNLLTNHVFRVNFDTKIRTLLKTWNLRAKLLTEIRFWVNRSAIFQSTDRQMPSANHPSRITSNDPRHKRPLTFNAECNVRHDGNICPPAKAEIKDFYFRGRIYRSKIFFPALFLRACFYYKSNYDT